MGLHSVVKNLASYQVKKNSLNNLKITEQSSNF